MTIFSKHNQLIFSALASLFVLSSLPSCQREPSPVDENLYLTDEPILIQAAGSDVQTRGLLNKADLPKVDSKVKVYDYLTGFRGKMTVGQTTYDGTTTPVNVMYIDDEVECVTPGSETNPEGDWNFASGHNWRWTRTGTHNFFGWLTHDGNGSGMDIPSEWASFDPGSKTLGVGPITMNSGTPQFDFSYSDIVAVDVESDDFAADGTIELPLKHLFSALAISIRNDGEDVINLTSVTISGMNNTKSAAIDYSITASSPGVPRFSNQSSSNFIPALASPVELTRTGATLSLMDYTLMWPQTIREVEGTVITVNYTIAGDYKEDGTTLTPYSVHVELNQNGDFVEGMKAGSKYSVLLRFVGKTIDLKLIVLPWDYNEYSYDYSRDAIDSGPDGAGEIDFDQHYPGYNRSSRTMTLQSQTDVLQGSFMIYGPHSGEWALSVWGDGADYFTVYPTQGEINFDLSSGRQVVSFTVTPSTTAPDAGTEVALHFNVAILLNGEWVDANAEFNRKDWKMVWRQQ